MAIMSTFFAEIYPHLSAELLPLDMLLSTGPTAALHSEPHPRPRSPARYLRSGSQSLTHLEVWPNLLLSAVLSPPWRSRVYYSCCYQALDSAASHRGQLCSHLPVVRCRRWLRRSSANDSVFLVLQPTSSSSSRSASTSSSSSWQLLPLHSASLGCSLLHWT